MERPSARNPPMSVPETRVARTPPPPNRGAASCGGSGLLSMPVARMHKPGETCPDFIAKPGRRCSTAAGGKTSSASTSAEYSPAQSACTAPRSSQLRRRLCVGRSIPCSKWVRTSCGSPMSMDDRIAKMSNKRYGRVHSARPWEGD